MAGQYTEDGETLVDIAEDYVVKIGVAEGVYYIQGLLPNVPEGWVQGTLADGKLTIPAGQYVGKDTRYGIGQYIVAGTNDAIEDIVLDYDATNDKFTTTSIIYTSSKKKSINWYIAINSGAVIGTRSAVNIADGIENGIIAVDKPKAFTGDVVTVTATPAEGYELDAITVKGADESAIEVSAENTFVMPAQAVTVSATFKKLPADVTVEAADITDGDITAAITAKAAGAPVKNLTINLAAGGDYKITAPIEAYTSVLINGAEDATIDASSLTGDNAIIKLPAGVSDMTNFGQIAFNNVNMKIATRLVYANKSKFWIEKIAVDNCVISVDGTFKKSIFDCNSGGNVKLLSVNNSTIYADPKIGQNGGFFSSQSSQKPTEFGDEETQTFQITNSTLYNITNGNNMVTLRENNKAYLNFIFKNNVIVNCGKNKEFFKGFGSANLCASSTWDVDGNIVNFGGVDTSADDLCGGEIKNPIKGVVTFADAAAGKFNGTLLTEAEPAVSPVAVGDPRWTIEAKKDVYSKSLNIEQLVLDKTTKADIAAALAEKNIEISSNAGLDSLNDEKTLRNEPFLGLKIKAADATVKVLVKKGNALNVKFGCVNDPVNVAINGTPIDTQVAKNTEGSVFTLPAAEADQEVVFTTTAKNTVVLKQIMIGEDIAAVTLPAATKYQVSVAEGIENGTVEFAATSMTDSKGYKTVKVGDEVTITATPAEGYELEAVTVKGVTSNEAIVVTDGKFTMPADAVTINATFKVSTGINAVKADALKDAQIYNLQGVRVDKAQKGLYIVNGRKVVIK